MKGTGDVCEFIPWIVGTKEADQGTETSGPGNTGERVMNMHEICCSFSFHVMSVQMLTF
jgi:hypothetical protein